MKKSKKILSLLLTFTVCLTMCIPAYAAPNANSATRETPEKQKMSRVSKIMEKQIRLRN